VVMNEYQKTIFIVDDNRSDLVIAKQALVSLYRVFTFVSATRMYEMLSETMPDLILLDVEMPELSGFDVLARLTNNKRTSDIPIIMLTALGSESSELMGLSMGAADYIKKPYSNALLLKRVALHLRYVDYRINLEMRVEEKTKETVALKNSLLKTLAELVERRDIATGRHLERTQIYIKTLISAAKKHGVYKKEISDFDEELVLQSSLLHDVGKISIPDAILLKPDELTYGEREVMKKHTIFGEEIIRNIMKTSEKNEFLEYARIFAVTHHERWDGFGYPNSLQGLEIPILGRIMAIADVYDALVTDRPYKKAYTHGQAVDIIIAGREKLFDPELVDLFIEYDSEFEMVSTTFGQK